MSDDFAAGMRRAAEIVRDMFWHIPSAGEEVASAILAAIPASAPWTPPEDRQDGFECLAQNIYGTWKHVRWQWGRWTIKGDQTREIHKPEAFAPLPEQGALK